MKTIGLSMIVKDEAHVILKCLESVRPLVDYVLVVDTGSADGTQRIVRDYLVREQLPGGVVEEPWQNFAYNRTFALQELRKTPHVDYALIIDADDQLELDDGFDPKTFKAGMNRDLYDVEVLHGSIVHVRPQLFRNDLPFSFKGVVHEYLEAPPDDLSRGRATGFRVKINGGGARSRNTRKFEDDATLLERTLSTEIDPFMISRYTFYLAQSYRDCSAKEKALENYLKRAELGYWAEEIYISLLEAGNLMAALDRPFDEVIATYLRASDFVPTRAEALHAASRYCRDHGRNAEGYEYARRGIDLTQPPRALFAQPWIYDYGLLDEYAINAYWAGAYRESLDASLRLLASNKLPQSMHARVAANARFAADKLPKPPNLGSLGSEVFIEQHKLVPQRPLRSTVRGARRVLLAILAKQKEAALPLYLDCIEALDYPKSSIVLYIRTNNNTDRSEQILRDWVARFGHFYAAVEFDATDVDSKVEELREHEWNPTRFRVLGQIRDASLQRARELDCKFYFVADVDNFLRRSTLRELIALNLPIVGPLLRPIIPQKLYSNYHADIDADGYYKHCDQYYWILSRQVRGVVEVPVIHCTYLIRADVIPELTYQDGTDRHEYVIFSDSARKAGIPQYIDNRQLYGYITFAEGELYLSGGIERARSMLQNDLCQRSRNIEGQGSAPCEIHKQKDHPFLPDIRQDVIHHNDLTRSLSEQQLPAMNKKFLEIYKNNEWWFGSGVGSLPLNNVEYIKFVQLFIEKNNIMSVMDFGCGDWQFSRFINWGGTRYIGFDIVESVIEHNKTLFENDKISFKVFTTGMDLPSADLIICKDVFQHLSNKSVRQYLDIFKARARYLLITNDDWPAVNLLNTDIDEGGWRPLLLDREPFCEAAPIVLSWMIEWGGCKPTRKVTSLVLGDQHSNSTSGYDLTIHVINLDRSVDRLTEFRRRNPHLGRVVRFPAVDGRTLDRSRLIDEGIIASDLQYSEGALGCAISHMELWKMAVREQRPITIAEDDVLFTHHFEARSRSLLACLPIDWDIVFWSFNFEQKVWVEALPEVARAQFDFYEGPLRRNIENFQELDANSVLFKLGHLFGAICYSISPKGSRALLDFCIPLRAMHIDFPGFAVTIGNEGIDCVMNGAYPSLRAFVCVPPLVVTDNRGKSTIRG
jgi:GR25 family glycosyltransferase involved in LPS biosynthesis/glycosyltransferase involved in cell wall biosynthesis/SAM-dependent methyltransferase